MAAAAAVADPGLNEFEVGGRWFACVGSVDPDLLIWVMARSQRPPVNQHDPALTEWLSCIVSFLLAAVVEHERDAFLAHVTGAVATDADGTLDELAAVFGGLLALYTDHQTDEVREHVMVLEERAATRFPARETPVVRQRTTLPQLEAILARHGRKATGRVIRPGG